MKVRPPKPVAAEPDPDAVEPDAQDAPRTPGGDRAPLRERHPPRGLDPFGAFREWAGPIDDADYADL